MKSPWKGANTLPSGSFSLVLSDAHPVLLPCLPIYLAIVFVQATIPTHLHYSYQPPAQSPCPTPLDQFSIPIVIFLKLKSGITLLFKTLHCLPTVF